MSDDDLPIISILAKDGSLNALQTLSMVTTGFVTGDFEVRIFVMDDAVMAFKKENIPAEFNLSSAYPDFDRKFEEKLKSGESQSWWDLMADLKEIGDVTIKVCALVAEIVHAEKEDFHELVDAIAGVATFAADVDESDFVLTI